MQEQKLLQQINELPEYLRMEVLKYNEPSLFFFGRGDPDFAFHLQDMKKDGITDMELNKLHKDIASSGKESNFVAVAVDGGLLFVTETQWDETRKKSFEKALEEPLRFKIHDLKDNFEIKEKVGEITYRNVIVEVVFNNDTQQEAIVAEFKKLEDNEFLEQKEMIEEIKSWIRSV